MTQVEVGQRTAASAPQGPKRRRVWPWVLLGLLVSLLVAVGVGLLLLPGILLGYVQKEARAQGVVLEGCSLEYSLERLELSQCKFELVDVPGVGGTLEKATIALSDFEPTHVSVEGAHVVIRQLPDKPTGELIPRWLEQRSKLGKDARIPLEVKASRLELFGTSETGQQDATPLVSLTELSYESTTEALAGNITIGDLLVGKVSQKGTRSELDVALKMSPDTRAHFSMETTAEGAEVRSEITRLPLAMFQAPPFIELPEELTAVQVDLRVYAMVPFGLDTKGVHGDFSATVAGMPMPVPREIEGLVYGPEVFVDGKFKVHANNQKLEVSALKVKSGVLELTGTASLEQKNLRFPLQAQLRGSLSCGAILEAATRAHTNSPLALAAAKLARKMVKGGVGIVVVLDTDLLKLKSAKLLKTIGVGCGLEPLPVPEELAGLPEKILKGLPVPRLPELPEITLPGPPRIELPRLPELPPRRRLDEGRGEEGRPAPSAAPPP